MHERLSTAEKKRALAGASIGALGAFLLGASSLDSAGTPLLVMYFGGGAVLAAFAVTLLVSLR